MVTLSLMRVQSPITVLEPMVTKSPTDTFFPSLALQAIWQRPRCLRYFFFISETYLSRSARAEYAFSTLTIVGVTGALGLKSAFTSRTEALLV